MANHHKSTHNLATDELLAQELLLSIRTIKTICEPINSLDDINNLSHSFPDVITQALKNYYLYGGAHLTKLRRQ